MSKYVVTQLSNEGHMPQGAGGEVNAACYATQATNGAGLVADFFSEVGDVTPSHTFAHVTGVSKVTEAEDRQPLRIIIRYLDANGVSQKYGVKLPEETGPEFCIDMRHVTGSGKGISDEPWNASEKR